MLKPAPVSAKLHWSFRNFIKAAGGYAHVEKILHYSSQTTDVDSARALCLIFSFSGCHLYFDPAAVRLSEAYKRYFKKMCNHSELSTCIKDQG